MACSTKIERARRIQAERNLLQTEDETLFKLEEARSSNSIQRETYAKEKEMLEQEIQYKKALKVEKDVRQYFLILLTIIYYTYVLFELFLV